MLGLIGLMGAVLAGFMIDAWMAQDGNDPAPEGEDDDTTPAAAVSSQFLQDDPNALNDPSAGMPASGDDQPVPDHDETLTGGSLDDILSGAGGNDKISGAAGNDLLGGRAGNDELAGGGGADWMHGDEGDDTLQGAAGDDDLQGEMGADRLIGGAGGDRLSGGAGRDMLVAGAGNDALIGGEAADRLHGGAGEDALQGGHGNDRAMGDAGSDVVDGNAGNDTLWGDRFGHDDGEVDFLNGGAGDDVLHAGAGYYVTGGAGADSFELATFEPDDPVVQISDFNPDEDTLLITYDPAGQPEPEVSVVSEDGSPDAMVLLNGVPVAHVVGGAGMTAAEVRLQAE